MLFDFIVNKFGKMYMLDTFMEVKPVYASVPILECLRIKLISGLHIAIVSRVGIVLSGDLTMKQVSKYFSMLFVIMALVSVVACSSTPKKEGAGEYVDDSVITTKVKAAILQEPTLKVAEINVETFKGVVQLSGFVASQSDINTAVKIAAGVGGVKSVKNDMRLK